jgi:hypothetical protein
MDISMDLENRVEPKQIPMIQGTMMGVVSSNMEDLDGNR